MANSTYDQSSKANSATPDYKTPNQEILSKISDHASNLTEDATRYFQSRREYVKRNPTLGVAIAATAGIVLGSFLTMLLRTKK